MGSFLVAVGGVWFFFALIWLPPGAFLLTTLNDYFHIVYSSEIFLSATIVALGTLLRKGSVRKLTILDCVIASIGVLLAVFLVFGVLGTLPFSRL